MNQYESRLKKIEEILSPKKKMVLILDYITIEPASWIEVNRQKYVIPPDADLDKFIHEKVKLIKGIQICTLYLGKDRTNNPSADFSGLTANSDLVMSVRGYSNNAMPKA